MIDCALPCKIVEERRQAADRSALGGWFLGS
jgi:hypothetical protein